MEVNFILGNGTCSKRKMVNPGIPTNTFGLRDIDLEEDGLNAFAQSSGLFSDHSFLFTYTQASSLVAGFH